MVPASGVLALVSEKEAVMRHDGDVEAILDGDFIGDLAIKPMCLPVLDVSAKDVVVVIAPRAAFTAVSTEAEGGAKLCIVRDWQLGLQGEVEDV